MRLTKKKAIERSIEHWTWLAKTGKEKEEWPGWEQYGDTSNDCFLCEYSEMYNGCGSCPYWKKFGICCTGSVSPFEYWWKAKTVVARKKYARLFLEQLKQL